MNNEPFTYSAEHPRKVLRDKFAIALANGFAANPDSSELKPDDADYIYKIADAFVAYSEKYND